MKKISIELNNVKPKSAAKLVVICESPLVSNPKMSMDKAVMTEKTDYVYEEEFLDNPWIRLVIHGIENLNYKRNNSTGIASAMQNLEYKGRHATMYVMFANPKIAYPQPILEGEVLRVVGNESYNAFTDCSRTNPWVRIVIVGLNEILGGEW